MFHDGVPRSCSGGNADEKKSLAEFIRLHRPPFFFPGGIRMNHRPGVSPCPRLTSPPPPPYPFAWALRPRLLGTTKDGLFTLLEVECLGACANAPMVQVRATCSDGGSVGRSLLGRLCYALVCLRCLRCYALLACPGFRCLLARLPPCLDQNLFYLSWNAPLSPQKNLSC